MDRAPHQRTPHSLLADEKLGQLFLVEALEAHPQSKVGRVRHLGLHACEVLDSIGGSHGDATKQELPGQERTVERTAAKHDSRVLSHAPAISASTRAVSSGRENIGQWPVGRATT